MTARRPPTSDPFLVAWFEDGPTTMPDRVVDVVADRIGRTRQRRPWRLPWRLPMNMQLKLAAGAAAVLVLAIAGYSLLPRQAGPGGSSTPVPTALPTASPVAALPLADGTLTAGRYRIPLEFIDPGLSVVADVPAGWIGHPDVIALTSNAGNNNGILLTFMKVDGLFSDPCQWDLAGTGSVDQPGDVTVGPTVDDLVSALKANSSYPSSTPKPVAFGAFAGQELELRLPGDDVIRACDRRQGQDAGDYFVFPRGFYAQGPNSRWHLYIADVAGSRVVTLVSIAEGSTAAEVAAAEAIVASFEFAP